MVKTDRNRKYDLREVVSENIRSLMAAHPVLTSQSEIARHCEIPQRTVGRIINCETQANLGSIVGIATAFGIEPWQLLVPGLNPEKPPHLSFLTIEEANALQALSKAVADIQAVQVRNETKVSS